MEEYLPKCIESILNQTYRNLEILLVDDGSPDNCGRICDEYAAKDSRIRIIHKKNGGLSDARNAALDVMTGEYVTFIDSDDYVSDDYVEYLYKIIKESGVKLSVSSYQTFVDDSSAEICTNNPLFVKIVHTNDALTGMFYQQIFDTSAWAKMYHRSLFLMEFVILKVGCMKIYLLLTA
ncbi:glycosyltransferase [Phocaeicola dorei]|nr:glycosyltransferase [Phocaeicola dorei]